MDGLKARLVAQDYFELWGKGPKILVLGSPVACLKPAKFINMIDLATSSIHEKLVLLHAFIGNYNISMLGNN